MKIKVDKLILKPQSLMFCFCLQGERDQSTTVNMEKAKEDAQVQCDACWENVSLFVSLCCISLCLFVFFLPPRLCTRLERRSGELMSPNSSKSCVRAASLSSDRVRTPCFRSSLFILDEHEAVF